jgi:hypothetical protein
MDFRGIPSRRQKFPAHIWARCFYESSFAAKRAMNSSVDCTSKITTKRHHRAF